MPRVRVVILNGALYARAMTDDQLVAAYLADREFPCPRCGYSLRGLTRAQCPECGRELRLRLETIGPGPPDAEVERARLRAYLGARNVKCPGCGRNLRGHDGLECPACGRELSVWLLKPIGVERPLRSLIGALVLIALGVGAIVCVGVVFWAFGGGP